MENNIYTVQHKYLAMALSYLGFRFFKDGFDEKTVYRFDNTENFREALTGLTELRNRVKK